MVASFSPHRHHGETATLFSQPTSPSPSRHILRSPTGCSSPFALNLVPTTRTRSATRRSSPTKQRTGTGAGSGSPVKFPLSVTTDNEIKPPPRMTLRSGSTSPRAKSPQRATRSLGLCASMGPPGMRSPTKHDDDADSLDHASRGSPVAKKRNGNFTFHNSGDSSPFESPTKQPGQKKGAGHVFEKPSFARSRPQARQQLDFSGSSDTTSRSRRVTSVENLLIQQRDSPFGAPKAPLPNPSSHAVLPHPLSKSVQNAIAMESARDWETPQNFKNAKPNPAAFHSTGFVSKRGRLSLEPQQHSNQPDTPCKGKLLFPGSVMQHRGSNSGIPIPNFSSPNMSSPQTPLPDRSAFRNTSRRDSVSTDDSDNDDRYNYDLGGRLEADSNPPTPTKPPQNRSSNGALTLNSLNKRARADTDDLRSSFCETPDSPHTPAPKESAIPDPSSLSISGKVYNPSKKRQSMPLFPLATPAKELFTNNSASKATFGSKYGFDTPMPKTLDAKARDYTRFASRFSECKIVGSGEFSSVYRVLEMTNEPSSPCAFGTPSHSSKPLATPTPLSPIYTSPQTGPSGESPKQYYAVKRSNTRFKGPLDRKRQMEEAQILKSLGKHPHVIEFINSWEEDEHLCIQTEFCEKGSLDAWLLKIGNKGRLDEFRVWKIAIELCMGLEHIHRSGFMHLDLKPANVLITTAGTLKICDFGMASSVPAPPGFEREGDRDYLAPEVLGNGNNYDTPVDIFSLGLTMIEVAGNEALPPNGPEYEALRAGDIGGAPVLSTSLTNEFVYRDGEGNAVATEDISDGESRDKPSSQEHNVPAKRQRNSRDDFSRRYASRMHHRPRPGDLVDPPQFMAEGTLEEIVKLMIRPDPKERPSATDLLNFPAFRWVDDRRLAPATVFEGLWGPGDEKIAEARAESQAEADNDWDMAL